MTNEQIGMILSLLGMAVTIASFQARKKPMLLLLQSIGSSFFLVSYIFSGGGIAIFLNVIYLIRNFLYTRLDGREKKIRSIVCGVLCAGYIVTYAVFTPLAGLEMAENLWNLLPVIGAVFGTIAAMQTDMIKLRLFKIGDSLSWLAYNSHIGLGAIGGILGEVLNQFSIYIGIWRTVRERKRNRSSEA